MDTYRWWFFRLLIVVGFTFSAGVFAQANTAAQLTVEPISTNPIGLNPGGGIQTQMTYEARFAANDGALADTSYITRSVAIGEGTMGGMVRGAVAGGLRFAGWVGLAVTAYELYKWYTDSNGNLMAPGATVPGYNCGGSNYWGLNAFGAVSCSLPGMQAVIEAESMNFFAQYSGQAPTSVTVTCTASGGNNATCSVVEHWPNPTWANTQTFTASLHAGAPSTVSDPTYTTNPVAVTNAQLGQLAEQHPDWWPDMLTDPQTGKPIVTPEVATDIDDVKKLLAPKYGIDPQTLPTTNPDPGYLTGQASPDPTPTSIPEYCAWASAACNYYKFVEDNWPDADGKKQETDSPDCITPPSCSGDDVMCAVVRNTWANKCALTGDQPPPDGGTHVVSDIDSGDKDLGDASSLDQSGFGFGSSCPFQNVNVPVGESSFNIDFGPVCTYGPWMRIFILLMAALKCAQIIGGVRSQT